MPRILKNTPRWLSRPSPGFQTLAAPSSLSPDRRDEVTSGAPKRRELAKRIACRGTEVFVVVRDELRWSDLVMLKELHEDLEQGNHGDGEDNSSSAYRILKIPVYRDIRQLVISPSGDYLAIVTSHTVHIAVLPTSSHLTSNDTGPLKLKTYQVGPTQHVLDQSPLSSVIWHPLGINGACLLTVSEDAVLRLWEFDRENRWSVNDPASAIDLRQLANGSSSTQDFSPSKALVLSPDTFDMEVAAACFGGSGHAAENGWASMTLWVAMRGGDIYAISPLLPKRFSMSHSLLDRLGRNIVLKCQTLEGDRASSKADMTTALDQLAWVMELLEQQSQPGTLDETGSFARPTRASLTPTLQGPFHVEPDADVLYDVTDIFTFPAQEQIESDESLDVESEKQTKMQDSPFGMLCIGTSDNRVHVCLDTNRTAGLWLSAQEINANDLVRFDDSQLPELLLVDSVQLSEPVETCHLQFTADPHSPFSTFVTHADGVEHISINDWMKTLQAELDTPGVAGSAFRLKLLAEGTQARIDSALRKDTLSTPTTSDPLSDACVALSDSDLGHFVLTRTLGQPYASHLDNSDHTAIADGEDFCLSADPENEENDLQLESREIYQPSTEFWAETTLPGIMKQYLSREPRRSLKDQIRISPFSLNVMTEAHHVLSQETHRVNGAVSTLFSRCERLQEEFVAQIQRACEVANEIDSVLDDDADVLDDEAESPGIIDNINRRMNRARNRSQDLGKRYETIRQKVSKLVTGPLSEKEGAWVSEIAQLDKLVGEDEVHSINEEGEDESRASATLEKRLDDVLDIKSELIDQVRERGDSTEDGEQPAKSTPSRLDQAQPMNIEAMLKRQTILVEMMNKKLVELGSLLSEARS